MDREGVAVALRKRLLNDNLTRESHFPDDRHHFKPRESHFPYDRDHTEARESLFPGV